MKKVIFAGFALLFMSTQAATIIVDSADDHLTTLGYENVCTLRNAIQSANQDTSVGSCIAGSGEDTVVFSTAIADKPIVLKGQQLEITDSLTVKGNDEQKQHISGDFQSRIFAFNKRYTDKKSRHLTLENLFLIQGKATLSLKTGKVLDIPSHLICSSESGNGGAICSVVDLSLNNTDLINNSADNKGGGFYSENNSTIFDTFISLNRANLAGGFWSNQKTTVKNSIVDTNIAKTFYGGFFSGYATDVIDSIIRQNEAEKFGGFFTENLLEDAAENSIEGDILIKNSTIEKNKAKHSGALGHVGGQLTIQNSTIANNAADDIGAFTSSNLLIDNSTISGNSDLNTVGGIKATARLSISHSTIANNVSVKGVGGLWADDYHDLSLVGNILGENRNQSGLNDCVINPVQSFVALNEVIEYNVISSGSSPTACNLPIIDPPSPITNYTIINYIGVLPKIEELADNGCHQKSGLISSKVNGDQHCVKTHALQVNSIAVDFLPAKTTTAIDYDQRGEGFVRDSKWDAGSFELNATQKARIFTDGFESASDIDKYEHETVKLSDGYSVEMYTYFPNKVLPKPQNGYPLILAFHGTSELIDFTGAGSHIRRREIVDGWRDPVIQRAYKPVILAPQVSSSRYWADDDEIYEVIHEEILELIESGVVDANRIYVTGHSVGGFATWDIARYFHSQGYLKFAAIAPMSSFWLATSPAPPKAALEGLPIWTFDHRNDITRNTKSFMPILRDDYQLTFVNNEQPETDSSDLQIHTMYTSSTLPCVGVRCHQVCDTAILDANFYHWLFKQKV